MKTSKKGIELKFSYKPNGSLRSLWCPSTSYLDSLVQQVSFSHSYERFSSLVNAFEFVELGLFLLDNFHFYAIVVMLSL